MSTTLSQMQMVRTARPYAAAAMRHRAIAAWCGASTFAVTPNTKRQRLKGPSPG